MRLVFGAELLLDLHRMRPWAACSRVNVAQPVPVTTDLLIKALSKFNLHDSTGKDVVHREEYRTLQDSSPMSPYVGSCLNTAREPRELVFHRLGCLTTRRET